MVQNIDMIILHQNRLIRGSWNDIHSYIKISLVAFKDLYRTQVAMVSNIDIIFIHQN